MARWKKYRPVESGGLFDEPTPTLEEAQAARDAGIEAADDGADPEWQEYAWRWLLDYLRGVQEFFPDDVWAAGLRQPRELRAFGALVLRAAKAGHIVKTDRTRQRTRGHATPALVWESRLYQEQTA